jgi:hypothetical protein
MPVPLYIDIRKLLPGDILLTRQKGEKDSQLIALFGGSRYSHAELYAGQSTTYEATTHVVGDQPHQKLVGSVGIRWIDDGLWRQCAGAQASQSGSGSAHNYSTDVMKTDRYAHCDVFRWHDDDEPGLQQFRDGVYDRGKAFRFRPYATLRDLTATLPLGLRLLAQSLGQFVDVIPPSYGSGLFCSQLVARIYEEGGLPLFRHLSPQYVTPRHLASSERLKNVTKDVAVPNPDAGEFHPSKLTAGRLQGIAALQRREVRQLDEIIPALILWQKDDVTRARLLYARANHLVEDNDLTAATTLLMEAIRLRPRDARLWELWITAHADLVASAEAGVTVGLTRLKALDPALGAEVSEWARKVFGIKDTEEGAHPDAPETRMSL